jgi:leucyl-tRNA synthetase
MNDLDGDTMDAAYTGEGTMVNSGDFDGMGNREAMEAIAALMEKNGIGKKTVSFRLGTGASPGSVTGAPPFP